MKKITLYIGILVVVAFFGACNLNETPRFDDKDAFVAFESERIPVKENAATLRIPIRLTSLQAKSTTLTFEVIDSTAIAGVDFNLKGGASVLTFDGSEAVQYIEFDILPHEGVFTGDRVFRVEIKSAGDVNLGSNIVTNITIQDLDHPLSIILGAYTATAVHYFDGTGLVWSNISFEKDPDGDVTKVWIKGNILNTTGAGSGSAVYGTVNDTKTEISIPVHQKVVNSSYDTFFDGINADGDIMESGEKLILEIETGDVTTIKLKENAAGILAYDKATGAYAGYYMIAENIVYKKVN